jgi:hypothetical protein
MSSVINQKETEKEALIKVYGGFLRQRGVLGLLP